MSGRKEEKDSGMHIDLPRIPENEWLFKTRHEQEEKEELEERKN